MWLKYVGSRTRESVVLEWAHVKYEFSEKNDYKCEIPNKEFAFIITPDKTDQFIPCEPPEAETTKLREDIADIEDTVSGKKKDKKGKK